MSRFMPVKTLKGGGQTSVGGGAIRNGLVIFQFAISIFLIVSTLVVFQQLNFIQSKDLGYSKNQVLLVDDAFAVGDQTTALKEEILKLSEVESATISSFMPTPSARSNSSYFKEGSKNQENAIQIQTWNVDHDYINTLNMELVAGRNFSLAITTDSTAVIINEATLKVLGVSAEEALGYRISQDIENRTSRSFTTSLVW